MLLLSRAGLVVVLIEMILAQSAGPTDADTPPPTDAKVLKLRETVRENLDNPQFNVDDLADRMGISRTTLYRLVRERTGLSANQLIQELRLLQARELLETGQYRTLRQVAEAVGFRSPDYLSRLYRARFGKSLLAGFSEDQPTRMN